LKSCPSIIATKLGIEDLSSSNVVASTKSNDEVFKRCLLCGNHSVPFVDRAVKKSKVYSKWLTECAECICYFLGMNVNKKPYHFFFEKARYCYQCHLELRDILQQFNSLKNSEKQLASLVYDLRTSLHQMANFTEDEMESELPVPTSKLTIDLVKQLSWRQIVIYVSKSECL